MCSTVWIGTKAVAIWLAKASVFLAVVSLLVLSLHYYMYQTLVLMALAALATWFMIELYIARLERLERQRSYSWHEEE